MQDHTVPVAEGFACKLCKAFHGKDVPAVRKLVAENPSRRTPIHAVTVCEEHFQQAIAGQADGTIIHENVQV